MTVLLSAVNDTLKRAGIIAGDQGALTSLSSNNNLQHDVDVTVQLWREAIAELFYFGVVPNSAAVGTIVVSSGTREYAVRPDFERFVDHPTLRPIRSYRLSYDPAVVCPLTSPTTIPITGDQEISLTSGQHAILQYPDYQVRGYVHVAGINGGTNRVRVIGGSQINPVEYDSSGPNGKYSTALRFQDIETAFVEGLFIDKGDYAGDCISFTTNGASDGGTLYVQNCRGVGINYKDTGNGDAITQHGDFIQITRRSTALFVDYCTADTRRQGILVNSAQPLTSGGNLRRVNINAYNSPTANRPLFYLQDDDAAAAIQWTLDRCYMYDRNSPPVSSILRLVAPSTFFGQTTTSAIVSGDTVSWPAATLISGLITYGIPPGGDYVPSTFTGLGYTSPGYGSQDPVLGPVLTLYPGGYHKMLRDQGTASDWRGQPQHYAINPSTGDVRLDREPTSDEDGAMLQYLYERTVNYTATMDDAELPISDGTYRSMVPVVAEWLERNKKRDYDQEEYLEAVTRAAMEARRLPSAKRYGREHVRRD